METTPYVDAVRSDLEAVSGGDEGAASAFERFGSALASSLQLHLYDAVGQAALELSQQLPSGRVEVRLAGRDVQLVYVADEAQPTPPPSEEGSTARLTLRMPEGLKTRVERAAADEGISTNAWLVRAVTRGLDKRGWDRPRRVGARITGFAQG